MAFEKFTRTGARIGTPMVSIWARGQIGFNQAVVDDYEIDKFEFVVLYYDKDTKRIGLEFTNNKMAEGACKLAFRKNAGVSISAIAFLKTYKIDYSETKKFDLDYDEDSGFHIIDLDNPIR